MAEAPSFESLVKGGGVSWALPVILGLPALALAGYTGQYGIARSIRYGSLDAEPLLATAASVVFLVALLAFWWRRDAQVRREQRRVLEQPHDVVCIYELVQQFSRSGTHVYAVVVFRDGARVRIMIGGAPPGPDRPGLNHWAALQPELRARFPNAVLGYDPSLDARFGPEPARAA